MTDDLLLEDRIQHALHGCLDILDGLINNLVKTNVYALSLGRCLCHGIRTNVKSNDDRVGCTCQNNVGLVDRTYAAMDTLNDNLFVGELEQGSLYGLHTTLNVSLNDQVQLLQIAFLNL